MARKLIKRSAKRKSFFKILLGDFSKHLRIPPAFIKNFNGRSLCKCVLRGPSGKRWTVQLEERKNGLFFCEGWQGFVKDHHLQVGDFLLFSYNGESKFKVKIFDKSACEKDVEVVERSSCSSVSLGNKGNQARVKDEVVNLATESYNEDSENKVTIPNRRSRNVLSGKKPTTDFEKETSMGCISFKSKNPCFVKTLKKHQLFCLTIPKNLAEGLRSGTDVLLRNQTGRSWPVKLIARRNSYTRMDLTTGWGQCLKENQISVGDTLIFEFVKKSVIQIHIFRAVRGRRCSVVLDAPNVM